MASREDILSLQERVKRALATIAELKKTPQPMSGDSWVMYRRLIAPAWDFEVHGVTGTTYNKLFKVTYNVDRPDTGFILNFTDIQFDSDIAQNMSYNVAPVKGDPYSLWLRVKHVTYTADPGGISIRFNIFSPQKGTISVTEII